MLFWTEFTGKECFLYGTLRKFKVLNPTKLSSHTSTISHMRYKYFHINYEYICKIVDANVCETIFFLDIKYSCLYYLFIYFHLFLLT